MVIYLTLDVSDNSDTYTTGMKLSFPKKEFETAIKALWPFLRGGRQVDIFFEDIGKPSKGDYPVTLGKWSGELVGAWKDELTALFEQVKTKLSLIP